MLQSAGLLGVAAMASQVVADDKPSKKILFHAGKLEAVASDALKQNEFSVNVSPDGEAMTVVFSNLQLAFPNGKAFSASKVATLRIPFALPDDRDLVGFVQDIRGHVQQTQGARLALIADLGGATKVFEFPYDQHGDDGANTRNFHFEMFSLARTGQKNPSMQRPAVPSHAINFFLTAQRRTLDDEALITIDSFDVEATFQHEGAAKSDRKANRK